MSETRSRVLDSFLLFVFTAALIWPLFKAGYMDNWASIDSTFIADARFLREHFPHPAWQPDWYCGTRFDYIYPPALRYATAGLSAVLNTTTARAYHLYTATLYCLGVVGVYLLARAGMRSRLWAALAAVASTIISPSFLFLENFRADYAGERWMPVRLGVLTRYGEGPHSSALALLPFALAAGYFGLRRGRGGMLALSALMAALVVSNNFYGATALALSFPILVWTVFLAERDPLVFLRAAGLAALAYSLTAFWLVPSYLHITLRNMRLVSQPGNWWSPIVFGAVLAVYCSQTFRRAYGKPDRSWTVFVCGIFIVFTAQVLGEHYVNFRILGEPQRLVPEFDLAFIFFACILLGWLWRRPGIIAKVAVAVLLIAAFIPSKGWLRRTHKYIPKNSNYQQRIEYKIGQWIRENLPGERVLVTGSVRFWFNAWGDHPQVGGGSEQGVLNMVPYMAYFAAPFGIPPDDVKAWLQAVGTGAFVVHDQESEEIYKDFGDRSHVYDNAFQVIYNDGKGNRIFRIPRKPGRARVVRLNQIQALPRVGDIQPPIEPVRAYAAALEEGPHVSAQADRESPTRVRLRATVAPGQALVFQESFDPAWRALTRDGKPVTVVADPFGFMLLQPEPGDHEILLEFKTPLENRVGGFVTVAGLIAVCGIAVRSRKTA